MAVEEGKANFNVEKVSKELGEYSTPMRTNTINETKEQRVKVVTMIQSKMNTEISKQQAFAISDHSFRGIGWGQLLDGYELGKECQLWK